MKKVRISMEQQNSGAILQLWDWIAVGMGGVLAYLANALRGKASRSHIESIQKEIKSLDDEKVGKDRFEEFKEGNTALHKANGEKLDTVISQLNSRLPQ